MPKQLLKNKCIYYLVFGTYKKFPIFFSKTLCNHLVKYLYFYKEKYNFKLYSYSIIPCHLNLLAYFRKKEDIIDFEHDFKSYSTNQFIKLIKNKKILDYQFICGLKCGCRKFRLRHNSEPPCPLLYPLNPCSTLYASQITRETFQIVKVKNRIWRHKSWKYIVNNKENFHEKLNYIYYNPVKHGLITKKEIHKYPFTYKI